MTETCHRYRVSRDVRRVMYAANVAEAVGDITHGCEIYGLARGQYSLIDLVEHILGFTGPARLTISTWTAAGADVDYALRLCQDGRVLGITWIVDASFPVRQPGYCAAMRDRFGDECIRVTKSHAKFVLIGNDDWHVVLRTSMNLNENRRLESWEVSDDPRLFAYLEEIVAEIFAPEALATSLEDTAGAVERAFHAQTLEHIPPPKRVRYLR